MSKTNAGGPGILVLVRLALSGGRADGMRVVTTFGASVATMCLMLTVASVWSIRDSDGPYAYALLSEAGLRRGLGLGLCVFIFLLGALTAQCSRIGGPARDRRLAAFRLAGATPTDVIRLVSLETTIVTGFAGLAGCLVFASVRRLVDGPMTMLGSYTREIPVSADTVRFERAHGQVHLLPTDVDLGWWAYGLAVALLMASIWCISQSVLRRVVISPFGVVRRSDVRTPRLGPAVMFVTGTLTLILFDGLRNVLGLADDASKVTTGAVILAGTLTTVGLLVGVAGLSQALGQFLAPRTRHASVLIAARRMAVLPFTSSRVNVVILSVALFGGFFQGLKSYILVATEPTSNPFYAATLNFVDVLLALSVVLASLGVLVNTGELLVTGRQQLSALVAAGVPRSVLRRSMLLESVLPLAIAAPGAVVAGVFSARGVFGTSVGRSLGTAAQERIEIICVPVPWTPALLLSLGVLTAAGLMSWVAVGLVDSTTDPAELRSTA